MRQNETKLKMVFLLFVHPFNSLSLLFIIFILSGEKIFFLFLYFLGRYLIYIYIDI